MCLLFRNLGASTSWKPQGLDRVCFTFYAVHCVTNVLVYVRHRFNGDNPGLQDDYSDYEAVMVAAELSSMPGKDKQ